MSKQNSIYRLVVGVLIITSGCASTTSRTSAPAVPTSHEGVVLEASYDLRKVGARSHTLRIDGTLSATGGPQSVSNVPFNAVVAGQDSMRITMSGPLGITMAQLYAREEYFVFVNYFQRQILDGRPSAPEMVRVLPFPVNIADLAALIRGSIPGRVGRFSQVSVRQDGTVLFGSPIGTGMEFAPVDTASSTLRQYQRKAADGSLQLNVTFDDVRLVGDVPVAHAIDVLVDDKRQALSFRLTSATIHAERVERLALDIPSSFTRTTYR